MKNNIVGLSQVEINCINGGSKDSIHVPNCDPSDPGCQEEIRFYEKVRHQWAGIKKEDWSKPPVKAKISESKS